MVDMDGWLDTNQRPRGIMVRGQPNGVFGNSNLMAIRNPFIVKIDGPVLKSKSWPLKKVKEVNCLTRAVSKKPSQTIRRITRHGESSKSGFIHQLSQ